jgi:hypothetical protein
MKFTVVWGVTPCSLVNVYRLLQKPAGSRLHGVTNQKTTICAVFSLEEDILKLDLLERLDSEDLSELRKYFFCLDTDRKTTLVRRKQQEVQKYGGQPLTRKEFVKAIERIVGKWRTAA